MALHQNSWYLYPTGLALHRNMGTAPPWPCVCLHLTGPQRETTPKGARNGSAWTHVRLVLLQSDQVGQSRATAPPTQH